VARQTRAERRARRAASMGGEAALSGAPRRSPARPSAQPEPEPRRVPGGGAKRFVGESIGELKKVEWPRQPQVVAGTTVVLIACLVVGVFLYLNDRVWTYVVQNWLLGQ
jgi:preprotein translocase SecE subunit